MNHRKTNRTSHTTIFDFDQSTGFQIDENLNTTQETGYTLNPFYSCRPIHGHSLTTDYLNPWKLQEEPRDNSKYEIARSCRVHRFPKGGF